MQNWKTVGPVIVWDIVDHTYQWFDSLDSFITSIYCSISDRIGDQSTLDKFARTRWADKHPIIFPKRYLVRDENGLIIPLWKLEERQTQLGVCKPRIYSMRWYRRRQEYEYRKDPVPYVRCYRGGNSYFRNVGTFRERRENDFCNDYDEDAKFYGVRARSARTTGNLPEPWDDISRSDWGHRSWKRHRKTQWKSKKK